MRVLDPTFIRDEVDYSFGDDSGHAIYKGYTKPANASNTEFISKYWQLQGVKPYMTLFIDNIRLYRRSCIKYTAVEQMLDEWKRIKDAKIEKLKDDNLLALLATMPGMKFVIFTGFEDTPTDEAIFDTIPDNVLAIYASDAIIFGGKVHPIPYGLQRILTIEDHRHDILVSTIETQVVPERLMYINYNNRNNSIRPALTEKFKNEPWVTLHQPGDIQDNVYYDYLINIKRHKFMLCPSGNAEGCECHRDWETIYMRRVPIVEDTPYHHAIFDPLEAPVLYVDSLFNVTEQLLIDNDYLYDKAQEYDMNKLDIEVLYNKYLKEAEALL